MVSKISRKDLRLIVDTFLECYVETMGKDTSFRMTDSKKILIENFATKFGKLQKTNLKSYMLYQFRIYKDRGKVIQLNWILGNKSLERWNDRSKKQKKYITLINNKDLRNYKKKKLKIENEIQDSYFIELNEIEEKEKELFFNTDKCFVNCSLNTTLYNHKSKFCMNCKFKDKCKKELKNKYPKIYKMRGYE